MRHCTVLIIKAAEQQTDVKDVARQVAELLPGAEWIPSTNKVRVKTLDYAAIDAAVEMANGKSWSEAADRSGVSFPIMIFALLFILLYQIAISPSQIFVLLARVAIVAAIITAFVLFSRASRFKPWRSRVAQSTRIAIIFAAFLSYIFLDLSIPNLLRLGLGVGFAIMFIEDLAD
jgi:hypothetical protein